MPKQRSQKVPVVYIITNKRNGTLYTGVTSNILQRIYDHKHKTIPGFTSKYDLNKLVYYEQCDDMQTAIEREKQIKAGSRKQKVHLIESINPQWKDLSEDWFEDDL